MAGFGISSAFFFIGKLNSNTLYIGLPDVSNPMSCVLLLHNDLNGKSSLSISSANLLNLVIYCSSLVNIFKFSTELCSRKLSAIFLPNPILFILNNCLVSIIIISHSTFAKYLFNCSWLILSSLKSNIVIFTISLSRHISLISLNISFISNIVGSNPFIKN